MSQTDSIWVKVQLKSPPEKFYGFFRNHLEDLVYMFSENYESIRLVKGDNFSTGNVILFKYRLGNQFITAKYLLSVVDDVKKYIVYEAVEGDVLKQYKVLNVKLEVANGGLSKVGGSLAKWTVEFEKANENVPSPESYLELFLKISKGIDAYFSKN